MRHLAPAFVTPGGKRLRIEDDPAQSKRQKPRTDHVLVKREREETALAADDTASLWAPEFHEPSIARLSIPCSTPPSHSCLPTVAPADTKPDAFDEDDAATGDHGVPDDDDTTDLEDPHETILERRDRLMRQLRIAVGPEDIELALSTIPPRHSKIRDLLLSATTVDEKLEAFRTYRACSVKVSVRLLAKEKYVLPCLVAVPKLKNRLLPRCLSDCRLWVDPTDFSYSWRVSVRPEYPFTD